MVHEVHGSRRVPILRSILVGAGDLGTQSQHGRRIYENPSRLADFGGRALCHFHSPCLHHDKRFSDDLRRVLPILALHDFFRDDTDAENGGSCGTIRNKNSGAKVSEFYFLVTIAKLSSPAPPQIRNAALVSLITVSADLGTLFECARGVDREVPVRGGSRGASALGFVEYCQQPVVHLAQPRRPLGFNQLQRYILRPGLSSQATEAGKQHFRPP